ncbi:MAG: GGDEF domain-containing protein [Spirochaetia bacterium]
MTNKEIGFLQGVDIFSTLDHDELAIVHRYLQNVTCRPDQAVFHQNDNETDLYIVREGTVAVRVGTSEGVEVDIAQFGEGDFFGEMSLFEDAPRSATCVMTDGGKLFRLRKADFFSVMADHPGTAIKVMSRMASITAGRLQSTSAFLTDLVQWGENARRRAITDDLTGLHNRRFLDDALDEQLAQAKVGGDRFSLIMMDLDRFHGINDAHGQPFGDEVIAAVALPVADSIGETDIAARYGGDEFVIILPARGAEESLEIAERIRTSVEGLRVTAPNGDLVSVTTSQGIAEYPRHAADVETLREQADKALYVAKEAGRNRAAIAFDE